MSGGFTDAFYFCSFCAFFSCSISAGHKRNTDTEAWSDLMQIVKSVKNCPLLLFKMKLPCTHFIVHLIWNIIVPGAKVISSSYIRSDPFFFFLHLDNKREMKGWKVPGCALHNDSIIAKNVLWNNGGWGGVELSKRYIKSTLTLLGRKVGFYFCFCLLQASPVKVFHLIFDWVVTHSGRFLAVICEGERKQKMWITQIPEHS